MSLSYHPWTTQILPISFNGFIQKVLKSRWESESQDGRPTFCSSLLPFSFATVPSPPFIVEIHINGFRYNL